MSDEADEYKSIRSRASTNLRIKYRKQGSESANKIINQLLDETRTLRSPVEVLQTIRVACDSVLCIHAEHSTETPIPALTIVVSTPDANSFDEELDIFDPEEVIEFEDDEGSFTALFRVTARFTNPELADNALETPLYVSEEFLGAEPLSMEEGSERLTAKLRMMFE